jgi:hypothetical protein
MRFLVLAILLPLQALGAPRDQAKRLHDRLTGVPPSPQTLAQLESMIAAGQNKEAAMLVMNRDEFYNVNLRNWFSTWSNVAENPNVPLNDFTATAVGLVRDDVPFDQALYGDVLYVGNDQLVSTLNADGSVAVQRHLAPYSRTSNQHYVDLESRLINPANLADINSTARNTPISLRTYLQRKQQGAVTGLTDVAGLITTRASGEAFFSAGTNRRMLRFTFRNFLCLDMEQLQDTSRADFRVRRDVDRAPGGDSRTYKQTCVGCHAGMDGLAGAFAYFNFSNNQVTHTPGSVQGKYNQNNSIFPAGYVTTDNSWLNLWIAGPGSIVGWNGDASGTGARSLGEMLSKTNAFSQCMVKRVFRRTCLRDPSSSEADLVVRLANDFSAAGRYNMKDLFASVATLPQCLGD